jgi:electron transfer flavoprotein beta subunit
MKIAVCIKTITGGAVDRDDAFLRTARTLPAVLPPYDGHAVEEALRIRERRGGVSEIVLLSIGVREGLGALRQGLAMGADRAVLVSDPLLDGADISGVSRLLAALIEREAPDLTLYCPWSGDIDGSMMFAMAAARLGLPSLGQLRSLMTEDGRASGARQVETGDQQLSAPLPCLVEVNDSINKARNASIKGRQQANAKPVQLLSVSDLLPGDEFAAARTSILTVEPAPATRHPVLVEAKDAPDRLLALLGERRLLA